jgi:hypothetical protein
MIENPVKFEHLALLISHGTADAGSKLVSFLETDPEMSFAHKDVQNAASFDVIYEGISFRLRLSAEIPALSGLNKIFCSLDAATVGCCINISLGEHVAGGERVPAIMQALLSVAKKLGASLDAVGVIWHPANIVSGFSYFAESVANYAEGGAFPVLPLVNFKAEPDGSIGSTGLALLSGQELLVECNDMDQSEMMRRIVRVVHNIAVNGPVREPAELGGVEPGEILKLNPISESALLKIELPASV